MGDVVADTANDAVGDCGHGWAIHLSVLCSRSRLGTDTVSKQFMASYAGGEDHVFLLDCPFTMSNTHIHGRK